MADRARCLVMISQSYPYGKSEAFLERELEYLSKSFDHIELFPLAGFGHARTIPENVKINRLFIDRSHKTKKSIFFTSFGIILYFLMLEFGHTKSKWFFIKTILQQAAILVMTIEIADQFRKKNKHLLKAENRFYSVWMDEGALLFSLLKHKGLIDRFVFRLHGFDLYDERRKGGYMPFQYICFKYARKIYIVSKAGKDYLMKKKLFVEKLTVNYSGIHDNGLTNSSEDAEFTILSCSNLLKLKRVDRIIDALGLIKFKVRWIHMGDGPEMKRLKEASSMLPPNITVEFLGHLNYSSMIEVYKKNTIHVMVHLSETEGLPMSLAEALSFGVPIIATDVGGVNEIVNEKNGFLIPAEFDNNMLAEYLHYLYQNPNMRAKMAVSARDHYLKNFVADQNYASFVKSITS